MTGSILVVDDERAICIAIQRLLAGKGYQVDTAPSGEAAIERLERARFHLVITDLNLKTISGMDLLRWVRQHAPETAVVMITAFGSEKIAVEAIKLGAADYLPKPTTTTEEPTISVTVPQPDPTSTTTKPPKPGSGGG